MVVFWARCDSCLISRVNIIVTMSWNGESLFWPCFISPSDFILINQILNLRLCACQLLCTSRNVCGEKSYFWSYTLSVAFNAGSFLFSNPINYFFLTLWICDQLLLKQTINRHNLKCGDDWRWCMKKHSIPRETYWPCATCGCLNRYILFTQSEF